MFILDGREYSTKEMYELLVRKKQTIPLSKCRRETREEYAPPYFKNRKPKVIYAKYNTLYAVILDL